MPLPVLRETQNKIWPRHEDETLFSIVNGELPYDISSRESCSKMWDDIHRAYIIELPQSKRTKEELRAYWLEQGGRDMQLNESEVGRITRRTVITKITDTIFVERSIC